MIHTKSTLVKKVFLVPILLLLIFFYSSCRKASTEMLNEKVDSSAVLKVQGSFSGIGSEKVSGQAKVYLKNGKLFLALENFSTDNGPDLKVYLSQADVPSNFIKLGDLKSTKGNQLYDITGMPDFTKYKYALIHCERFNHLYGRAELK
jgi:hypothetical protein